MRHYPELTLPYSFQLLIVVILLITSCSRQLYPESSFQNAVTRSDQQKLNEFLNTGVGKSINTRNLTPDEVINTAQKYLGVPHCMGGSGMRCMDCSGLLVRAFAEHGVHLPHNSEEQARYGKIINGKDDLIRGDLVFFIKSYKTNQFITHSGIYTGENKFIHVSSRKGVTITSINDPWWNEKFIFGTRIF